MRVSTMADFDLLGKMMAWEDGSLDCDDVVPFFQRIVDSGLVWKLQGTYGRTAQNMLDAGMIEAPPESPSASAFKRCKPREVST